MDTQTRSDKKMHGRSRSRITYRMVMVSLLAVMIAARLGGGIVSASPLPECVVANEDLNQAKADYAVTCSQPRVDCDNIDGLWYCSSEIIGERAPGGLTAQDPGPTDEPTVDVPDVPASTPTADTTPPAAASCVVSAVGLGQAKAEYAATCSQPRVDCDKIDGLWFCSSEVIGDRAPGGLTGGANPTPVPPTPAPPTPVPPTPVPTEVPPTPVPPTPVPTEVPPTPVPPTPVPPTPVPTEVPPTPVPPTPVPPTPVPTEVPPTPVPPTPVPPTPEPTPSLPDGLHPDIVDVIDVEGRNPGGDGWKDSYSVGDQCYCATTFDHNIGGIEVDTPAGPKTVREVCGELGPGPGPLGRPIYNDVQCGNGPANDAGDEDDCPGRVDIGREGCGHIGPKWDLSIFN